MITTKIRNQLIIFWTVALVAAIVLAVMFMRVPAALGIGRYTLNANFADGGGLYQGAEVNYLGAPVGTVSSLKLTPTGIHVAMSLETKVSIPDNSTAAIHSVSAVGEQYVEIEPPSGAAASAASFTSGDTIPVNRTSYQVNISSVLHNVANLVNSLPSGDLASLLNQTSTALNGQIDNAHTILDGATNLITAANDAYPATAKLITDADPLLTTINNASPQITSLVNHLSDVSAQLKQSNGALQVLLKTGPGAAAQVTSLLQSLEPVLPTLLSPVNAVSGVLSIYHDYLAEVLSVYPEAMAEVQSVTLPNGGMNAVNLTIANADKPLECTQGFLPVSKWLMPDQAGNVYTPLYYCDMPPNDGSTIRGARNIPCAQNPNLRAATPALCRKVK